MADCKRQLHRNGLDNTRIEAVLMLANMLLMFTDDDWRLLKEAFIEC